MAGVAVREIAATMPKRPKPTLWTRLLPALRLHSVVVDLVMLLTIAPSKGGRRFERSERTKGGFRQRSLSMTTRKRLPDRNLTIHGSDDPSSHPVHDHETVGKQAVSIFRTWT